MSERAPAEFAYRVAGTRGGARPGAHRGRALGAGTDFAGHRRLFDAPDPRRLDVRASLASVPREWRVRTHRQRAAIALRAVVDVSASMRFGAKLDVVAEFLAALGHSAFRGGDAAGLEGFDERAIDALSLPPRTGRGAGARLVAALDAARAGPARAGSLAGLADCLRRVPSPAAITFVVSDFHVDLAPLARTLELAGDTRVVPVVVWDPAEIEPPAGTGWLPLVDAESGRPRRVWLRAATRRAWADGVARRREALAAAFRACDVAAFRVEGAFDADALSRHFLEAST